MVIKNKAHKISLIIIVTVILSPSLTNIIFGHGNLFNLDVNWAFWDMNHLHVAWKDRRN